MTRIVYKARRPRRFPFAGPIGLAVLAAILAPGFSFAQTGQPAAPPSAAAAAAVTPLPRLTAPTITLADAVKLTVGNSPQIRLAQQDLRTSGGQLQQTRGPFDWTLNLTPAFTYTNTALAPSVRNDETNRRLKLQAVAAAFGLVNRRLLDTLATLGPAPPRCPLTFATASDATGPNRFDPLSFTITGLPILENSHITLGSEFNQTLAAFKSNSVCAPADQSGAIPSLLGVDWSQLPLAIAGSGLNEEMVRLEQTPNEVIGFSQQLAQAIAARAQLSLERIGVVPLDEVVSTLKLDGSLFKQFRNGISGSVHMHLESDEDNFKHKSLDPNFGGLGRPIMFPSQFGVSLTFPFGQGRGRVATDSPEVAADLTVTARGDSMRFTATSEVFRTVLAYLNLAGAQESVRSLEESATRQDRIAQLTRQLVEAGDLPAVEQGRAQARAASVATALAQARGSLVDARVSLADAMGVDVATLANAPLAADGFMTGLANVPDAASLMQAAASSRLDLRALGNLQKAARVLNEGAWANVRPRFDVTVDGGMGNFYENQLFFYLPGELNPVFTQLPQEAPFQPSGDALRFGNPVGIWRGWTTRPWRPFATVKLTIGLPLRLNTFRGRAAQAQASMQRTDIQAQDLSRTIRQNITNEVGSLGLLAGAVQQQQASVDASQKTLDGALQRFQQGEVTLIDTLLTEQNLTQDRLALVQAWQQYLSELARLKFETGTLIFFTGSDVTPDQVRFDPVELVKR